MDVVQLTSGRKVVIRPIRTDDGPSLQAAYARLSPQSKYRRFLAPKPRLTEAETRYLVHIDGYDHLALVATPPDHPNWILAVARYVRLPEDPGLAEVAVVVADDLQNDGLGTAILARLALAAAARGITRLKATMLAENEPARRMVRAVAGGRMRAHHRGTVDEIVIDLTR
jgi:protein lysine acetyltransferase